MTVQTRISDLVSNPGVLANLVTQNFRYNNSLIASGVAVTGPEVDLLMTGGSQIQRLNYINKVDTSKYNHSSDDYDAKGETGKITATPYDALRQDLNWGWTATDLLKIITKYDANGHAITAIPKYWSEVLENIATASMLGCLRDDADLIIGDDNDAFDVDAWIDAAAGFDDPRAQLTAFVTRKSFAKLKKLQRNDFVPPSLANFNIAQFEGVNIIVTEAFGPNMTVLATAGSLAFGAGQVPGQIAGETKRDSDAGNGGGGEVYRTRLSMVAAPQGFSYTGAVKPNLEDIGDTNYATSLTNPLNWTKKASDDLVGFRGIMHAA